jgi:hypothetical protein
VEMRKISEQSPQPISAVTIRALTSKCIDAMQPDSHKPIVCVICDRFMTKSQDHETYPISNIPPQTLANMMKFLSAPASLDPLLKLQYDISQCSVFQPPSETVGSPSNTVADDAHRTTLEQVEQLHGLLLSPRGITVDGQLVFCRECLTPLQLKKCNNPPKFAIANGNAVGHLPSELSDLTLAETLLIAQVRKACS